MRLAFTLFAIAITACGSGVRQVARPTAPTGYRPVELRDVAPMGLQDENVEIVAALGPMVSQEICDGLVTFPLLGPDFAMTGSDVATMSAAVSTYGSVTITIPRARYAEVRDLRPFQKVRVRGYLSTWYAAGCDWYSQTAARYMWIDSIEPVAP